MKKIVRLLLIAICASPMVMAQNYDDLYYNPKKDTSVVKRERVKKTPSTTTIATTMPVVVKDVNGNVRDVDEYNRRFNSDEYKFNINNDTLYVEEDNEDRGWINGFQGSQDDYEYALRIIRFHDPRFAVSISSPYYWDIVYGLSAWDWNIYVDDFYAYAFPTFTNRLWSDWRFGTLGRGFGYNWGYNYYGWGFGFDYGWGYPYYGYYPGYWGGYYGGYWGSPYYGWHGGAGRVGGYYNTRRSDFGIAGRDNVGRRTSGFSRIAGVQDRTTNGVVRRTASGRVIGTRSDDNSGVIRRSGSRFETINSGRTDGMSRRSSGYTRPSSTRTYSPSDDGTVTRRGSSYNRSESTAPATRTYNRGNSTSTRSYSPGEGSRRSTGPSSYDNNSRSSSPSRSYSPSSSSSRSESFGSSRSSGGSSGGGSSSGGSSRSSGGRR
ncbi:hypothetical protein [Bacteroides sedimenti]|uniref:Vitellogenin II n=1 Tax=Bacteroides sedimenti TaxID=2136147 RepID=A0ABM8IAT5_9BACE